MAAIPELIEYFNNNCLNVKFSYVFESTSVSFLDLSLEGNATTGVTETSTSCKKTAGNKILSANLCHPLHTIKATPIGELVSTKRNCSTESSFSIEKNNICNRLWYRKYPKWMLDRTMNKADYISRDHLLKNKGNSPLERKCPVVFSTP